MYNRKQVWVSTIGSFYYCDVFKIEQWAGKMVQQVRRVFAALPVYLSLISRSIDLCHGSSPSIALWAPGTHMVHIKHTQRFVRVYTYI